MKYAVRIPSMRAWATDYDGGFALDRQGARLWGTRRAADFASLGSHLDAEVIEVEDEDAWRAEENAW